jgi:hypothetical protein
VSFVVVEAGYFFIQFFGDALRVAILANFEALLSETGKNSAAEADVPCLSYTAAVVAKAAAESVSRLADVFGL